MAGFGVSESHGFVAHRGKARSARVRQKVDAPGADNCVGDRDYCLSTEQEAGPPCLGNCVVRDRGHGLSILDSLDAVVVLSENNRGDECPSSSHSDDSCLSGEAKSGEVD